MTLLTMQEQQMQAQFGLQLSPEELEDQLHAVDQAFDDLIERTEISQDPVNRM